MDGKAGDRYAAGKSLKHHKSEGIRFAWKHEYICRGIDARQFRALARAEKDRVRKLCLKACAGRAIADNDFRAGNVCAKKRLKIFFYRYPADRKQYWFGKMLQAGVLGLGWMKEVVVNAARPQLRLVNAPAFEFIAQALCGRQNGTRPLVKFAHNWPDEIG